MQYKKATMEDFDTAFDYMLKLWDTKQYDKEEMKALYREVIADDNSYVFFLVDEEGGYHGLCHGVYYNTFWLSGLTSYVSTVIVNEGERGQGLGTKMLDHVVALAKERGCKGVILDSGLPREGAHKFYERYGFNKGCYGFDLVFKD